jgi:hypothetical protein
MTDLTLGEDILLTTDPAFLDLDLVLTVHPTMNLVPTSLLDGKVAPCVIVHSISCSDILELLYYQRLKTYFLH